MIKVRDSAQQIANFLTLGNHLAALVFSSVMRKLHKMILKSFLGLGFYDRILGIH